MKLAAKIVLIYLGVMAIGFILVILATWRQKQRNDKQAKRYSALWESLRPVIDGVLFADGAVDAIALPVRDRAFARYTLAQLALYADRLAEESLMSLAKVLEAIGQHHMIRRMTRSRRTSVRVEAMHWISTFRLFDFKTEVFVALEDGNWLVEEKAFLAAVRILSDRDLERLLLWMDARPRDFTQVDRIARALAVLDRDENFTSVSFVEGLYHLVQTSYAKRVLCEWIGHASVTEAAPLLKRILLEEHDAEVRIGAIRSMIRLNASPFLEDIIQVCLNREGSDGVRIVGARALVRLAEERDKERCLPVWMDLLGDNLWWVRTYAAAGIAMQPQGRQILERCSVEHSDPFAREMAAYFAQILEDQGALWRSIERSLATG